MRYTVTLTDWTKPRGYRGSGQGWRVRCFGTDPSDWNAMSVTISETFHKSHTAALRTAQDLAREWGATISVPKLRAGA